MSSEKAVTHLLFFRAVCADVPSVGVGGSAETLPARAALSKLLKCEGGAGAEGEILPYVGHLQLI